MKNGKDLCNRLKAMRKAMADANGIEYNPAECHHEGDCAGTCPACDAELEQLNEALQQKRDRGEEIVVPHDEVDVDAFDTVDEQIIIDFGSPGIIDMSCPDDYEPLLMGIMRAPRELLGDIAIEECDDDDASEWD